jgi:hypothetical protein
MLNFLRFNKPPIHSQADTSFADAIKQFNERSGQVSSATLPQIIPEGEFGYKRKELEAVFPWLIDYWRTVFQKYEPNQKELPSYYHGTRLSALTGIRYRGLIAAPEKSGSEGIYVTFSPLASALHILANSNFDTYADERPAISNIDEADPPLILKIDLNRLIHSGVINLVPESKSARNPPSLTQMIKSLLWEQKYHPIGSVNGVNIGTVVPVEFITVVVFDKELNKVVEKSVGEYIEDLISHQTPTDKTTQLSKLPA